MGKVLSCKVCTIFFCWSLLPIFAGCTKSAEPEPTISQPVSNAQEEAQKAKKEAERQQDLVVEDAKRQVPIPSGPKTIEIPANMDDLDKRILKEAIDDK